MFKAIREWPVNKFSGKLWTPDHWWLGVTVTDQEDADTKMPELLKIPGRHWISMEPAMDGIDFNALSDGDEPQLNMNALSGLRENPFGSVVTRGYGPKIDWLVVGSSNNPKRMPCKLEWLESAVEQARSAGVPVWCKQIHLDGKVCKGINKFPASLRWRERP